MKLTEKSVEKQPLTFADLGPLDVFIYDGQLMINMGNDAPFDALVVGTCDFYTIPPDREVRRVVIDEVIYRVTDT